MTGVTQAPFPGFIEPMHPTQHAKVPTGAQWQYEIKLDGWRGQLHLRASVAKMFSRNGHDITDKCATIATAAGDIQARTAIFDGEIVVVQDSRGVPDFLALRSAMSRGQGRLLFFAFDLMHLDGFDLRAASLADRRAVLKQVLANKPGGRILMSETIDLEEPPALLYRHACELGMEGLVAKRVDAPYRSGRVQSWIKVKCVRRLALPIIGYVPSGNTIVAIRLGRHDGRELVYAGKAGTGFTVKSAQSVRERFLPLHRKTPPLAKPLKRPDTIWVEPQVEADIAFTEITDDGMLRHASFKGLR